MQTDNWQIYSKCIDGNTGFFRATIIDAATKSEIAVYRENVLGTTYPALEQKAHTLAAAPELLAELREVAAQFDALLRAHGKAFGWGFLTTQKARELIARIEGTGTTPTPSMPVNPHAISTNCGDSTLNALSARAEKLGSHFTTSDRAGCFNYYDRNGSHAFCVSVRELADTIASDENSRAADSAEDRPSVGEFIRIPAWKVEGMVLSVKPSDNPEYKWDVVLERKPDDPHTHTYRLNPGQFTVE